MQYFKWQLGEYSGQDSWRFYCFYNQLQLWQSAQKTLNDPCRSPYSVVILKIWVEFLILPANGFYQQLAEFELWYSWWNLELEEDQFDISPALVS